MWCPLLQDRIAPQPAAADEAASLATAAEGREMAARVRGIAGRAKEQVHLALCFTVPAHGLETFAKQ